ncbi:MAG: hypothetical protein CVU90_02080 [Firmicutes bacterium HGW-Firmicutes-15]|nr:MAG: hypothetical protein CVU90_02080 [Firmicutes bacterium HGW-Firmicutes-15]
MNSENGLGVRFFGYLAAFIVYATVMLSFAGLYHSILKDNIPDSLIAISSIAWLILSVWSLMHYKRDAENRERNWMMWPMVRAAMRYSQEIGKEIDSFTSDNWKTVFSNVDYRFYTERYSKNWIMAATAAREDVSFSIELAGISYDTSHLH